MEYLLLEKPKLGRKLINLSLNRILDDISEMRCHFLYAKELLGISS
ncbi:protein of unknown function [Chryseobacterium sp. JV274]|nr:protein of unknown function [Chryseobacterium sp. JV274]